VSENTETTAVQTAEATPASNAPPRKRKHKLPSGKITPVEFRHLLVDKGHAPDTLNSAQIYILTRSAKSNGMPVKHYDAEGKAFDDLQVDGAGNTVTRPGLDADEALEWWTNRPKRGEATAKKVKGGTTDEAAKKIWAATHEGEGEPTAEQLDALKKAIDEATSVKAAQENSGVEISEPTAADFAEAADDEDDDEGIDVDESEAE
jgi:hypothetical protein